MARKQQAKKVRKVVTEYEEEDEQPPQAQWSEAEEFGEDLQVQSILDGIGPGEIKIKILKWGPKGKSYCFSLDGGPVDEDFIQQQFGGGRYHGQIFKNGIYTGNSFELNIADRIANPSMSGGMADIQTRMMQQQIDFLKDMVLRNGQQQQTPVGELADALTKVTALTGNGGGGMGEKAVELILKGIELGKAIGGGKDESWTDVIREAIPVVGEMMQQRKQNPGGQPQQADQTQQVNSLPAAAPDAVIRQGIAYLKGKAITGRDPGLYVDWMIDNAEEPQYQPILHFILTSEFSALEQIDPEISKQPYADFFRTMYDGLRSAYSQQDQMDMDTGGSGGDGGNAKDDGKAGAGGKVGGRRAGA